MGLPGRAGFGGAGGAEAQRVDGVGWVRDHERSYAGSRCSNGGTGHLHAPGVGRPFNPRHVAGAARRQV